MTNKRKALYLLGETLRDIGVLGFVFGPLDAFFQAEQVSPGVIGLLVLVSLSLIGVGIIIEATEEERR